MQASESIHIVGHALNMENIMDTYGKEIYHLVFCYVNDKSIAEDLTQEVFLAAYLKQNSFRNESNIKTWISRIAINKCKDYLRSSYFKRTIITNIIAPLMKKVATSPEEEVIQKRNNDSLADLVLNLPIKYREIILLYYYQEFDVKEISQLLGMNEATVKSRLRRGREQLKLTIEETDLV